MIRHMFLMLALVAVFAVVGCATNRGGPAWAPPSVPGSSGGGSCPSCG